MSTETVPQVDEPVVTSSAQETPAAPIADNATEQNQTESTADSADGEQAPETQHDDPAPLPKGVQRKINKLTRKAGDAERTARELQLERDLLVERLRNYEKPAPQQQASQPQDDDDSPTIEQFDYDDALHKKALIKWAADKALVQFHQQAEQKKSEETQRERTARLAKLEAAFEAEHPDYEEVAKAPNVPITAAMAEAIMDTDIAPAIAYYLGQNVEEAASIAQLSPVAQGRAIGRIEAKLSAPSSSTPGQPPRRITNAPPPPTQLNSAAPIAKALEDITDMDEYAAARNKQRTARGLA